MNLMARIGARWWGLRLQKALLFSIIILIASVLVLAASDLVQEWSSHDKEETESQHRRVLSFMYEKGRLGYKHVWPDMKFGWKIVLGSIIAFFGAACGSVGGVGGGGIFVPMLILIIGFDAKSSTAISKCMVTGTAVATVYYNLKLRHPTLELPMIDYDLALLFQPMLILGISLGVALNVIFSDWMITVLLIVLFIVTSTMAFFRGVATWKKETKSKKEASGDLELNAERIEGEEDKVSPEDPSNEVHTENEVLKNEEVSVIENVCWKELGLLIAVWLIILGLQIGKNYSSTCSALYWLLNLLQIPVAVGASSYEAVSLFKGRKNIASLGEATKNFRTHQLVFYCAIGLLAGVVGGMLGLGGGFILGPLFLEMGVPPQVSSATTTFAMMFSASISVVEYYLLRRFPVPYALYFFGVAMVAAFAGQYVVRKLISLFGRASIIIFILSFTIFVSAISLGGVGIAHMIKRIERKEYMGFENICSYKA